MKNLFFLVLCSLITMSVQTPLYSQDTLIVTGFVTGLNNQPIPNTSGWIEWTDCNTYQSNTISTDVNGEYTYTMALDCPMTDSVVHVSFVCPTDTNIFVEDSIHAWRLGNYTYPNQLDIDLGNCQDSTITQDSCHLGFTQNDATGEVLLESWIQSGTAPYSYYWKVDGSHPLFALNSTFNIENHYGPGTYDACVKITDANNSVCEYCEIITVGEPVQDSCSVGFIQNDATGELVLESWVQSGAAPYSYYWEVDGSHPFFALGNTLNLEARYGEGTYDVCLEVTDVDSLVCEYCEVITVEAPPTDSCWIQVDSFELVCNDNGTPNNLLDDFTEAYITVNTNADQYYVQYPIQDPCNDIVNLGLIGPLAPGEPYRVAGNIREQYFNTISIFDEPFGANCSITYDVEAPNICPAATDTCIMNLSYKKGILDSWWTFTANPGYVDAPNAIYEWSLPAGANLTNPTQANDEEVYIDFDSIGTYLICTSLIDSITGNTLCEKCITVEYGTADCFVGFNYVLDTTTGETNFNVWNRVEGVVSPFTYNWSINGNLAQSGSNDNYGVVLEADSTYNVCLTIDGGHNTTCTECETVTTGSEGIPCYGQLGIRSDSTTVFFHSYNLAITGDPCNFGSGIPDGTSDWYVDGNLVTSNISTDFDIELESYPTGTYTVCLFRTTSATGNTCHYCTSITIGEPDTCIDWSVINLSDAPCNFNYNPVCGCDGETYRNACVAYFCFGITDWTEGECGSTTSIDTCSTTAEFFYYAEPNPSGIGYDAHFFGYGVGADDFVWTFGDGTSATGQEQDYTFTATDSIQAYTVCLTAITWTDSCTSTVCETIVFDSTPNGYVSGTVVQGGNIWDGDENIVMRSNTEGTALEGILVELQDAAGNIITTTITDAAGKYSFGNLQFGDYYVFVNIAGKEHTPYHIALRPTYQNDDEINFEVRNSEVVGNNEVNFATDISIFPNPTKDFVNLSMSVTKRVAIDIQITDVLGRIIYSSSQSLNPGHENIRVDMENLSSGLYLINIHSEGEAMTKKIIKK